MLEWKFDDFELNAARCDAIMDGLECILILLVNLVQCVFIAGELEGGVRIRVRHANRDLTNNSTKLGYFIVNFIKFLKATKLSRQIVGYVRGLWRLVCCSKPQNP